MGQILFVCFTGLVMPLLLMMAQRHYKANPNEWEMVAVITAVGLVAAVGGFWIFSLEAFGAGSWGGIIVGMLSSWSVILGCGALLVAGSEAVSLIHKSRAE
jgi:hypothetical protein